MRAIRAAAARLGTFDLRGCELFSSCEPCPMCLGAVYWARLDRLFYASTKADAAGAGFDDSFIYDEMPLRPDERSLPSVQMLRDEAARVFEAWINKDDRVEY